MPRKTLYKPTKKRRGKKPFPFIKLLFLPILVLVILFTVFQLQQRQIFQEHAQTPACGTPGDKGNELGVGKFCTQGGGQCLGTGAPICSADIQLNGSGICSKACNTDADCGIGATCFQDTLGKGCKPNVCTTTQPTATPQPTILIPTAIPTDIPSPTTLPTTLLPSPTIAQPSAPITSPQSTSLLLSVYLHGIGNSGDNRNQVSTLSNKTPVHPQRSFTVTLMDSQNNPISTIQLVFTYDPAKGLYVATATLGNSVSTGNYGITIKTAGFLKKTTQAVAIIRGQQLSPAAISLTAGDVNNDDQLDMLDYNSIISCFSELSQPVSCTDPQKLSAADINDDGKVNQTDYNLFLREISLQTH